MFLGIFFSKTAKRKSPTQKNSNDFKPLTKSRPFPSNLNEAGICISINEAALVFYLQGSEVFIPFIFFLEDVNSRQSFISKKYKQYLSKSIIKIARVFLFVVMVIQSCSSLPIKVRKYGVVGGHFPFILFEGGE